MSLTHSQCSRQPYSAWKLTLHLLYNGHIWLINDSGSKWIRTFQRQEAIWKTYFSFVFAVVSFISLCQRGRMMVEGCWNNTLPGGDICPVLMDSFKQSDRPVPAARSAQERVQHISTAHSTGWNCGTSERHAIENINNRHQRGCCLHCLLEPLWLFVFLKHFHSKDKD